MSLDQKLNCPSCRREHEIDHLRLAPAICTRCACELEILVSIRTSASDQLGKAWQAVREMDYPAASQYVETAWKLLSAEEIAECGMIVSVLNGDEAGIRRWGSAMGKL